MLITLGRFLNRNQWQAALIILLLAALPLLQWAALLMMALLVLRKGRNQSIILLIAALLPSLFLLVARPFSWLWLGNIASIIVLWLLAMALHKTCSWRIVLHVATGLGIVIVTLIFYVHPDIVQGWQQYFQQLEKLLKLQNFEQQVQLTQHMALVMTGIQVAIKLLFNLGLLMIARWWQAMMFNPGQLRMELHHISLSRVFSIITLISVAGAMIVQSPWLINMAIVMVSPFILSGLSLVHGFAATKSSPSSWLLVVYLLLILPYMLIALITISLIDSWVQWRCRWTTN